MRSIGEDVRNRLERLDLPFDRTGIDPYGVCKRHLETFFVALGTLYRHYFRTSVYGLQHVPSSGRVMIVGNHSGGIALDAAMILSALFFELDPPRLAHAMADRFLSRLPFTAAWTGKWGQLTGLPEHASRLLEDDRALLVFPEGARGTAKLFHERYTLRTFGTGFVRLAMENKTPVVPVAFLGGGEAIPTVVNLVRLGRMVGAPYLPVTPYLLPLPLPVAIQIRFGEPLEFKGSGREEDALVSQHVARVQSTIATLIEEGRQ